MEMRRSRGRGWKVHAGKEMLAVGIRHGESNSSDEGIPECLSAAPKTNSSLPISRNLHRRRPRYRHRSQAVDIRLCVLPRQRRERDPGHPPRNRARNHALPVHGGGLVVDHVRLIHPADVQPLAQILLAHSRRVKDELDRSAAPGRLAGHLCRQGRDDGESGRGGAGAFDDEGRREVEGVGGGDAGVEGGRVGHVADGALAEEGVVAGFDRQDGGGALHRPGVREGEARDDVDDGAEADGGDDVGQREELVRVADGECVFARRESGRAVRFQDPLGRLHVDELLRLHARDDVDGVVVSVVRVPFGGEVLQPFEEEGRLQVLEEVDAGEVGYGAGGDAEGGRTVGRASTSCGGGGWRLAGEDEGGGGGEKEEEGDDG